MFVRVPAPAYNGRSTPATAVVIIASMIVVMIPAGSGS